MIKIEVPGFHISKVIQETQGGAVFRAVKASDGKTYILKYRSQVDRDFRAVQQLRHAHAVMERVQSPFIVKSFGILEVKDGLVHVCEDFDGQSLDEARLAPMEASAFIAIATSMCDALSALHACNFVHKDIKPSNFIYNPRTRLLKLTDFGTAAHLPFGAQLIDPSSMIEGTLAFISPEQTGRMNRSLDFRADLYALGISFYQLLTGRLPFEAQDPLGWIHNHVARQAVLPHDVLASIPPILSSVVMRLLAKRAEDRYQDAASLKRDLEHCLSQGFDPNLQLDSGDEVGRFRLSQCIFGRDAELKALERSFQESLQSKRSTILTVSGYSGIGKTTLVNELQQTIVRSSGLIAAGKFDQLKRDIPLATLSEAIRKLVQQLLSTNDHDLEGWRQALTAALGRNSRVLYDICPELALILGPQPPVVELDPAEAQNRFNMTLISLLKVLASDEHPLVVFLDDLQWADNGTLNLLEMIGMRPDIGNLLFILSYRDNEVSETHPLMLGLGALQRARVPMSKLVLKPLDDEAIESIIADMLGADRNTVRPLAALITARTRGNPFFTIEFLKTLYKDRILHFDRQISAWVWNEDAAAALGISDNVVDLMVRRIQGFGPACQNTMTLAAAIGNSCRLSDLATLAGIDPLRILQDVSEAINEGLLIVVRGHRQDGLRFQHDRIHQSAYSLTAAGERPSLHIQIARLLVRSRSKEDIDADVFEIVNHFHRGLNLITDPAEAWQLLLLSLLAGRKSKASTAYHTALFYLRLAQGLMPEDAWEKHYRIAYELHLEMAECLFLAGDLKASDELFRLVLARAADELDRAKIYYLQIKLFQVAGRYGEAADLSLASFRVFDCDLNEATAQEAFLAEVALANELRAGRPADALADLPAVSDPQIRVLIGLLEASAPPLYMARPSLFPVIVMKMVTYSMRYGNCPASCYGYGVYGLLLAAAFGDPQLGLDFVNMALKLNDRYRDPKLRGAILHLLGDHVNFWKNPMADNVAILERGFTACLEAGDLIYSNYIAFQGVWQSFERGETLDVMAGEASKYAEFALQAKHDSNHKTVLLEKQFARALQGFTRGPADFNDDGFDAQEAYRAIVDSGYACGIVYHDIMQQILHFFDRRFDASITAADAAQKNLSAALSMPIFTSYYFFRHLAQCARFEHMADDERAKVRTECESALNLYRGWAKECPTNFGARCALMEAEWGRLQGMPARDVLQRYEEARRHPVEIKPIHGLVCELEARFHWDRGEQSKAHQCMIEARQAYEAWGAGLKAQALTREFPQLALSANHRKFSTTTMVQSLDALAILKASQSISSEIELNRLLPKLMEVVMELTGAEECALVLFEDRHDRVENYSNVNALIPQRAWPVPLQDAVDIMPVSLINYVKRSGERLLLNSEAPFHAFRHDPYFQAHKPAALLCVPIIKQGHSLGALVLSNHHFADAFAAGRQSALDPILSQVAISIENATLFARLQAENRERQRKEEALKHSEQHMRLVTNALPALIAYVTAEGHLQSANSAFHSWFGLDEANVLRKPIAEILGADLMAVIAPHLAIARTGPKQEFVAEVKFPDGRLRDIHATCVPDGEGGVLRGIVMLIHDVTERRAAENERMRAQANAQAAQEASRIKSEFLANMSHEIRTPISGIIGLTELMLDTPLNREQKDFADGIRRSGEALLTVINDILDFSKMEAGKLDFEALPFSVAQCVEDTVQTMKFMADKKGIGLRFELQDSLPAQTMGDAGRVRQILNNLLGNAIKFTSQGEVSIKAWLESSRADSCVIRFEVKDSGIGIPAHVLPKLFSSFTQADSSTARRYGGSGLGLCICKHLVERMEGQIGVDSTIGSGSTFWFTLRLLRAEHASALQTKAPSATLDAHGVIGRILLAEDNRVNQTVAIHLLNKLGHYVEVVENGRQAIEALAAKPFDIVLMDCQMPEMDGYEATRNIRLSDAWYKDIPIIALTANAMSGDVDRCLAAGMNEYLAKPINSVRLGEVVRKWVNLARSKHTTAA